MLKCKESSILRMHTDDDIEVIPKRKKTQLFCILRTKIPADERKTYQNFFDTSTLQERTINEIFFL